MDADVSSLVAGAGVVGRDDLAKPVTLFSASLAKQGTGSVGLCNISLTLLSAEPCGVDLSGLLSGASQKTMVIALSFSSVCPI